MGTGSEPLSCFREILRVREVPVPIFLQPPSEIRFRFVRLVLSLLVVTLTPNTTLSNTESVASNASEAESPWEDATECLASAGTKLARNSQRRRPFSTHRNILTGSGTCLSRFFCPVHCLDGHRIRNGLLAPLRC